MRSNSNILILISAILAFLPVISVGYVLDGFVRVREVLQIQRSIDGIAEEAQASVYEAIDMMNATLAENSSVCTPNFMQSLRQKMHVSLFVRQVVVNGNNGVPYCDAVGAVMDVEPVSGELSLPGRSETVAAVMMPGIDIPMLRVTRDIDRNRKMSAFVNFSHNLLFGGIPSDLQNASMIGVYFTDDTSLFAAGDPDTFDVSKNGGDFVIANAFAGEVPIRIEVAVPFASVRAEYSDLYLALTLMASAVSAGFLFFALRLVRKSGIPSFDLEHAVISGDIRPYYQPVIDLSTGRVSGCEVLARWVKPNGKIIPPAAFIEYAEVTGLAVPMTIKLMETVKIDLAELARGDPELKISINLFEGHFRDGTIIEDVQAIFGESGISFRQLVFEITERFPLDDSAQTASVINGLHALGCKLAMDDVGTGHSNLSFVQSLGVDVIKIDRIFVRAIDEETTSAPVLDGLISMAQNLGTGIVAEGVETQAQAMYLRAKGVHQVQGFLFSPALEARKFHKMVETLNGLAPGVELDDKQAA